MKKPTYPKRTLRRAPVARSVDLQRTRRRAPVARSVDLQAVDEDSDASYKTQDFSESEASEDSDGEDVASVASEEELWDSAQSDTECSETFSVASDSE